MSKMDFGSTEDLRFDPYDSEKEDEGDDYGDEDEDYSGN